MKKAKAGYLFPLFALFVIFSDELFFSFVSLIGAELESGMKAKEAIVIAGIAYLLFGVDIIKHRFFQRNYTQFFVLFVILVLYFITGLIYPHTDAYDNYKTSLLLYGAICVPACYVGIRLARESYEEEIMRVLPYFVFFISFVVARAVFSSSIRMTLLGHGEDDVFNYQNSSYFLSFCYSYCFYYIFFWNRNGAEKKSFIQKFVRIIMIVLLFVCAISCILGGGRGAFVYLIAISGYLIFRVITRGGKKKKNYITLLILGIGIMAILFSQLNLFESTGFSRIQERLTSDDNRSDLWKNAMRVYEDSPLVGHGLGSIWWTVGFYSHNILTDLLAETGLIGATIILLVFVKMLRSLVRYSKINTFDLFMLVIFLGALVHDSFSGYWFSSFKFYLIFGYVFTRSYSMLKHNIRNH